MVLLPTPVQWVSAFRFKRALRATLAGHLAFRSYVPDVRLRLRGSMPHVSVVLRSPRLPASAYPALEKEASGHQLREWGVVRSLLHGVVRFQAAEHGFGDSVRVEESEAPWNYRMLGASAREFTVRLFPEAPRRKR